MSSQRKLFSAPTFSSGNLCSSSTAIFMCSAREGMLKSFELTERHFGWDTQPKAASTADVTAYRLDRALRSQGIVSLDSICHLDAPSKPRSDA